MMVSWKPLLSMSVRNSLPIFASYDAGISAVGYDGLLFWGSFYGLVK